MASIFKEAQDIFGSKKTERVGNPIFGFDKKALGSFMERGSSLASATTRTDANAPTFENVGFVGTQEFADTLSNRLTKEFTQDQVKGFVSAFNQRQDEVFRRRAQPGISQTRLV